MTCPCLRSLCIRCGSTVRSGGQSELRRVLPGATAASSSLCPGLSTSAVLKIRFGRQVGLDVGVDQIDPLLHRRQLRRFGCRATGPGRSYTPCPLAHSAAGHWAAPRRWTPLAGRETSAIAPSGRLWPDAYIIDHRCHGAFPGSCPLSRCGPRPGSPARATPSGANAYRLRRIESGCQGVAAMMDGRVSPSPPSVSSPPSPRRAASRPAQSAGSSRQPSAFGRYGVLCKSYKPPRTSGARRKAPLKPR